MHILTEVELAHGSIPRILLAKSGLDGNGREAKIVAHALKNAGFEVIYTGLQQTVEMIVEAAIQEDADVISLSIVSGGHIPFCRKLIDQLAKKGAPDIVVLVGGVIKGRDIKVLKDIGVAEVFPDGSDIDAPARYIKEHLM